MRTHLSLLFFTLDFLPPSFPSPPLLDPPPVPSPPPTPEPDLVPGPAPCLALSSLFTFRLSSLFCRLSALSRFSSSRRSLHVGQSDSSSVPALSTRWAHCTQTPSFLLLFLWASGQRFMTVVVVLQVSQCRALFLHIFSFSFSFPLVVLSGLRSEYQFVVCFWYGR
ncbi:hypothetical protein SODALDRAFT_110576 [Sodiomyces alkalinus F11]|uniref:REJ domain-containing protein n=1 Tax=Sodiomyces alkalinus (strain CBS 110278 / VKM F-3762 / F11) TaxID=1314773 RepID=A0A3N2Q2U2_SODAK|nr:hypothetical protein SODALDRAFT_110576 [Sodiomyces alkalinus F11]ROT41052.1 hypothetical protein SODALDRAFT_110576 [Sodiomyces alkalinus F11]